MKTGNTASRSDKSWQDRPASMEPGHEDREYAVLGMLDGAPAWPQWSPVMKTGNTDTRASAHRDTIPASMEPGHEDREYSQTY